MAINLLRAKQVQFRTGLSRAGIYKRMAEGTFPKSVSLGGGRAVAWVDEEIDQWILERIEEGKQALAGGKDDELSS